MNNKGLAYEIPPVVFNGITCCTSDEKAKAFNEHFSLQYMLENPDDPVPNIPRLDTEITTVVMTIEDVKT